ncbi:MAG: ABC transporter permease [Coriobacteriia bacterium]|nr:ABC transporter permease [Coriobacteriia bacterium]
MRSAKAIFIRQATDLFKNRLVMVQYIIFPVVAFIFTEMVAKADESIPDYMFVSMFAAIFAGMTLVATTAGVIAEDRENKSLRFLIMAGVKPHEYLLGIGGVILAASFLVSLAFALMGGFSAANFARFLTIMMLSSTASILLGASIGMLVRNQQAATAIGMPVAMILGFGPMLAMFNTTVEKIFSFFYTQQLNVVANDFTVDLTKPITIVLVNIAFLLVLFTVAYRKKGLSA